MNSIAFLLLVLLSVSPMFATPQGGDKLSTGDEELYVHGFTLNEQLGHQIWQAKTNRSYIMISSSNHRGFYATLVLESNKLYVEKLWIDAKTEDFPQGLQPVPFQEANDAEPLFASWFTGDLRHYYGEWLGYFTERTHERVFSFENGRLVSVTEGETEMYVRMKNRTNSLPQEKLRSESQEAQQSEAQDAAKQPPPAAAVRESSETMNPKPKSEAPADDGGR